MYSASDLKVGKKFLMNNDPFEVTYYGQKVMGRGGSIITVKAKNLLSGGIVSHTFSDKDMFHPADIEKNSYDYLYSDGVMFYFMSQDTYEQVDLDKNALDSAELFLKD